jgi:hypothetical protein
MQLDAPLRQLRGKRRRMRAPSRDDWIAPAHRVLPESLLRQSGAFRPPDRAVNVRRITVIILRGCCESDAAVIWAIFYETAFTLVFPVDWELLISAHQPEGTCVDAS